MEAFDCESVTCRAAASHGPIGPRGNHELVVGVAGLAFRAALPAGGRASAIDSVDGLEQMRSSCPSEPLWSSDARREAEMLSTDEFSPGSRYKRNGRKMKAMLTRTRKNDALYAGGKHRGTDGQLHEIDSNTRVNCQTVR